MDLRGQYKAHEGISPPIPAPIQIRTLALDPKASPSLANDNRTTAQLSVATQQDLANVRSELNGLSQTLASLCNAVKSDSKNSSHKLDNINTFLGTLEAGMMKALAADKNNPNPNRHNSNTTGNGSSSTSTSATTPSSSTSQSQSRRPSSREDTKRYVEDKLKEKIAQLEAEVIAQNAEDAAQKRRASAARREQTNYHEQLSNLQTQIAEAEARCAAAEAEREAMRSLYDSTLQEVDEIQGQWSEQLDAASAAQAELEAELRAALDREMDRTRRLFEQVQDLKGNIRVMCRIRPAPSSADPEELLDFGAPTPGEFSDQWGRLHVQAMRKGAMGLVAETKTFDFERVFGPDDSNNAVFNEIADLVQSGMEGKKVTVFAYGQTGSGKTHTMLGTETDPGIIPQAVGMMFDAAGHPPPDCEYSIAMSVIEVYQDTIHDLLVEPEHGKKAKVRLSEALWDDVTTAAEASANLAQASKWRTVAATSANEHSSRSHLILSFRITKSYLSGSRRAGQRTVGTLNLVDLAGSERTAAQGATGTQMREGVAINSDLMNLNLVITALGNGTRVPYDSALTKVLKGSLEKGSRTLMFVMVSPFRRDQSQTVQTLDKGAEATKAKLASMSRTNNFAGGSSSSAANKKSSTPSPATRPTPPAKATGHASVALAARSGNSTPSRVQQSCSIPRPAGSSSGRAPSVVSSRISSGAANSPRTPRTAR